MFKLTDSWIYPNGTPKAGSGLRTKVFYDPNNEVIKVCFWFSYHLCLGGGGVELGVKMINQNPGLKVRNIYFDIQ